MLFLARVLEEFGNILGHGHMGHVRQYARAISPAFSRPWATGWKPSSIGVRLPGSGFWGPSCARWPPVATVCDLYCPPWIAIPRNGELDPRRQRREPKWLSSDRNTRPGIVPVIAHLRLRGHGWPRMPYPKGKRTPCPDDRGTAARP